MFSLEYWSITDWFYIHSILCTGVYGSFNYFCWKKDLMKYVFPWILINYRLNLYPFHFVYWSPKLFKVILLKKKKLKIYVFPCICINSRSNLYPIHLVYWCVILSEMLFLTVKTLWIIIYDICFPLHIDQLQIKSILITYSVLMCNALLKVFSHNKDIMIYVFHCILINYRSNLYPFHIVYWSVMLS